MDHHEQHHLHHKKEREERIKHEEERERESQKLPQRIHPAWFIALGILLIAMAIFAWSFLVV